MIARAMTLLSHARRLSEAPWVLRASAASLLGWSAAIARVRANPRSRKDGIIPSSGRNCQDRLTLNRAKTHLKRVGV